VILYVRFGFCNRWKIEVENPYENKFAIQSDPGFDELLRNLPNVLPTSEREKSYSSKKKVKKGVGFVLNKNLIFFFFSFK
jgi:hypothetical protein